MEVSVLEKLSLNNNPKNNTSTATTVKFKVVQHRSKKSLPNGGAYGTGKRKNSIARVWVKPGKGTITINDRSYLDYFPREKYIAQILKPFVATNTTGQFDIFCTAQGGGLTGQAGAVVHGIAKALDCISDDFHPILKEHGLLTRDSRVVERKKYGKRKARKSTQFSKR